MNSIQLSTSVDNPCCCAFSLEGACPEGRPSVLQHTEPRQGVRKTLARQL